MVDVSFHNRGRNTNKSDTRTFELGLTGCIGSPVFGRVVDGAVHLNRETQLTAIEIEDEPPDRMLTPELETFQTPVTQAIPKDRLGRRQWTPECSRGRNIVNVLPGSLSHARQSNSRLREAGSRKPPKNSQQRPNSPLPRSRERGWG